MSPNQIGICVYLRQSVVKYFFTEPQEHREHSGVVHGPPRLRVCAKTIQIGSRLVPVPFKFISVHSRNNTQAGCLCSQWPRFRLTITATITADDSATHTLLIAFLNGTLTRLPLNGLSCVVLVLVFSTPNIQLSTLSSVNNCSGMERKIGSCPTS